MCKKQNETFEEFIIYFLDNRVDLILLSYS